MRSRLIWNSLAALALAGLAGSCYKDDSTGPKGGKPMARVLLTDDPFPFDSVAHVNVYVVRVDATTNPDTTVQDSGWVTVAEPHKVFDLLTLQQGDTALVGSGELSAGEYRAIRVVLDVDSSSILWSGGASMPVDWQNFGSSKVTLYALVESPVSVPQDGADIVIDFDVGRSFLYNYFGTKEFVLIPWIRAVNAAATGALEGTVTSDLYGPAQPLRNVGVTVYSGNPAAGIATWSIAATGHTDGAGHYRIAYLRPATYIVEFAEPIIPALPPVTDTGVVVVKGGTTSLSAELVRDTSGTSGSVFISGPSSVGVGGHLTLSAVVHDSSGHAVTSPAVTWTIVDTLAADTTAPVLTLDSTATLDSVGLAFFTGAQSGWVFVTATSGGFSASRAVQVVSQNTNPVASVAVSLASDTLAVADTAPTAFQATLRDSLGQQLTNRAVSWSSSDTTVLRIVGTNATYFDVYVSPLKPGVVTLTAISEGKVGQATVTVR